jgi:simple sugar transport system substrate-binding protein
MNPVPEAAVSRRHLLRRAGAGAAGVSLAQLLGPAAALASGGGDFPDHPRWRFVFVSHDTLDPLFVATQFGAQDAAALVRCSVEWTGSPRGSVDETVRALRSAVSRKADGIAVSLPDERAFGPALDRARQARIPLVAFNFGAGNARVAYTGQNPFAAGGQAGKEVAKAVHAGKVVVFAPSELRGWHSARLSGIQAGLGRPATVVRLTGDLPKQEKQVEAALGERPAARGAIALDTWGTVALGTLLKRLSRQLPAGGFDLLPNDLSLVADGTLDFVVDQQPYVQGFAPVLQLFLARISQGTVAPWDTETSTLLRRADVKAFVETRSRFEGSSSRHEYPLRRA